MLNRGRAAVALLGVACGFLTFLWARELFGTPGGLLALTLYAFSPMTLANGPLVTADMAAALFFLAATYAFWKATHRATLGTVAVSCAALSLLVLSKTSGVLIVPVFVLLAVVRIAAGPELAVTVPAGRRLGLSSVGGRSLGLLALLALHAAVLIPVLWMAYNFRTLGFGVTANHRAVFVFAGVFLCQRDGDEGVAGRNHRGHGVAPATRLRKDCG